MQYGNLLVAFNDLCDMAHTSSCSLLILNFASIYSSFSLSYKSFYTSFFSSPVDIFHMLIINFSFSLNILLATFNLLISNFKINITFCESPFALLCSGYFKKKKKILLNQCCEYCLLFSLPIPRQYKGCVLPYVFIADPTAGWRKAALGSQQPRQNLIWSL